MECFTLNCFHTIRKITELWLALFILYNFVHVLFADRSLNLIHIEFKATIYSEFLQNLVGKKKKNNSKGVLMEFIIMYYNNLKLIPHYFKILLDNMKFYEFQYIQ